MEIDQVKLSKTFKKYCSAQDLADFEKVSPATGVNGTMDGSKRDGTPTGNGFLAYRGDMKFGVRVSAGNIGE